MGGIGQGVHGRGWKEEKEWGKKHNSVLIKNVFYIPFSSDFLSLQQEKDQSSSSL